MARGKRKPRGSGKDRAPKKDGPEKEGRPEKETPPEETAEKQAAADRPTEGEPQEEKPGLAEQVTDLTDRLQRKAAEFANYQKRIHKEMDEARKYAVKPLALELLPALDSLERALSTEDTEKAGAGKEFVEGFRIIHEQLKAALSAHGIVPIEALNQPFDPNCHDAIMEEENPGLPDKTIIDELVKGYMIHDRLLRPSRVRVSRKPRPAADETEAAEDKPEPTPDAGEDSDPSGQSPESLDDERQE